MPKTYRPQLKFVDLFASQLERPCVNTGKIIRLVPRFRNLRQGLNAVGIMGLLLYSFRGDVGGSTAAFIRYFGILCGLILLLALANYVILKIAVYEEVPEEEKRENQSTEDVRVAIDPMVAQVQDDEVRLAKERQDELVSLYEKYAQEYAERQGQRTASQAGQTAATTDKEKIPSVADLQLIWDWRAYLPGTAEFRTNQEGVWLVMPMFYKKLMNIVLLILMMAAFFTMRYSPTIFYGVILAVLVLGFIAQQICVRYLSKQQLWEIKS